jgi:O-antigen chain-terminating methyltransferase
VPTDAEKIAELHAIVAAVRERVRSSQPPANGRNAEEAGAVSPIRVSPADLMPLVRARDAAQAKVAAIGAVNPRAGGILNRVIQAVKKLIARSLQWFVRDQVVFNRETITAIEAAIEAMDEQNRELLLLCAQINERLMPLPGDVVRLKAAVGEQSRALVSMQESLALSEESREALLAETRELKDVRIHWSEWRKQWEHNLSTNEIQFLRSVADLQSAFQHRVSLLESNFREIVQAQHRDYLGALDRTNVDIQKRLWQDLEKVREIYERMIHSELRLIRWRVSGLRADGMPANPSEPGGAPVPAPALDYSHFAERFRGTEQEIRGNMEFYRPFFAKCDKVLDIGCGRGEFLDVMREAGIHARGIDLSAESVQHCRENGLEAEVADLFTYLPAQPDGEFDGILSSQVVEHLPPERVPEMILLCASKLRRGGLLAFETPNPECLAIFATYFYLDPTHTRPMPHPYLRFCMEEAGLTAIEVHRLAPAIDVLPELAELPEAFRERLFGYLDYAIIGRKI